MTAPAKPAPASMQAAIDLLAYMKAEWRAAGGGEAYVESVARWLEAYDNRREGEGKDERE